MYKTYNVRKLLSLNAYKNSGILYDIHYFTTLFLIPALPSSRAILNTNSFEKQASITYTQETFLISALLVRLVLDPCTRFLIFCKPLWELQHPRLRKMNQWPANYDSIRIGIRGGEGLDCLLFAIPLFKTGGVYLLRPEDYTTDNRWDRGRLFFKIRRSVYKTSSHL